MKTGLQNESFIQRIKESGSLALKGKNERGINIFSGSVDDDGVISGRLVRPQYNVSELIKSVDVEITELIGREGPSTGSFVTRSLFEEQVQFNEELSDQLETAELRISNLSSRVEELNATTESLRVELDGLDVTNTTLDGQLSSLQTSFSQTNTDLQTALQNSTQEAIQRVSLSARNESLRQEVELLREQLFGRQSQVQAGAKASGTLISVNPQPIAEAANPRIFGRQKYRVGGWGKNFRENYPITVVNGSSITVMNFSDVIVNVTINKENSEWFNTSVRSFTIEPDEKFEITLTTNKDWTTSKYSNSKSGTITFTARADGEETQTEIFGTGIDRGRT